jgi:hypothetical protein
MNYALKIKFPVRENRFRHSSNIKVITSTIRETAVLVLLTGRTYENAVEMA